MQVFIASPRPLKLPAYAGLAQAAAAATRQAGHTALLGYRLIEQAGLRHAAEFMPFVREQIAACRLFLLLSAPELRGGLVEEGIAYALQVPVWLLHRRGEAYSSSAGGCALRILAYRDAADLEAQLGLAYQRLTRP